MYFQLPLIQLPWILQKKRVRGEEDEKEELQSQFREVNE